MADSILARRVSVVPWPFGTTSPLKDTASALCRATTGTSASL